MVDRSILPGNLLDLLGKLLSMLSLSFDWVVIHVLKHSSSIASLNGWHVPHASEEVFAPVIGVLLLVDEFADAFWGKNLVTFDL